MSKGSLFMSTEVVSYISQKDSNFLQTFCRKATCYVMLYNNSLSVRDLKTKRSHRKIQNDEFYFTAPAL